MIRIGIDLSLNSTGIAVDYNGKYVDYYLIVPKMTKKLKSQSKITVYLYDKEEISKTDTYQDREVKKFKNIYNIVNCIDHILSFYRNEDCHAYIEGISYGSSSTRALADLAGLNYCVRTVLNHNDIDFTIVSPMSNKKFACGIGNADKSVMIESWLQCDKNMRSVVEGIKCDDLADAYFLSQTEK